MAFITAEQTRSRTEVIPTTADLELKYSLVQGLITTAADDGLYAVNVTLGSDDQAQFATWIKSYGYRLLPSNAAGTSIRKILGTPVNSTVTWARYTITVPSATVAEGGTVVYTITTKGVADGTAYWALTGTSTAPDFTPNVSEGTVNIASGTGAVSLSVVTDMVVDPGETVILRLYYDSQKTDLVATAPTVTIT
jgi:hypothetical protein